MPAQTRYHCLLLTASILASVAQAAPVYRYLDKYGNVTYSDIRPAGREDVETVIVDPDVSPDLADSARERTERMQELSAELEESRKNRGEARADQLDRQRAQAPQIANYDYYRDSYRYPYSTPWFFWPRPHLYKPRHPGFRHPGLKPHPPIAWPGHPGYGPRPGIGHPGHPGPGLKPRPSTERPRSPGVRPRGTAGRSGGHRSKLAIPR